MHVRERKRMRERTRKRQAEKKTDGQTNKQTERERERLTKGPDPSKCFRESACARKRVRMHVFVCFIA